MQEIPSDPPAPAPAPIKRYAPPNQRNRALNRRKSGGQHHNQRFHIWQTGLYKDTWQIQFVSGVHSVFRIFLELANDTYHQIILFSLLSSLVLVEIPCPDRSEKANNLQSNDVDKNLATALHSVPSTGHLNAGSNKSVNEGFYPRLIAVNGCGRSEASQLLHERWKAAIDCYNDPSIDLSERPVMYTGSAASAWGNFRLPHQLMSCPQMDFLVKLQHAIHKSDANMKK